MDDSTPSRSEIIQTMLRDHLAVGRKKPLSYLPIRTIEKVVGMSLSQYAAMVEAKGGRYVALGPDRCCINSGAAYAYSDEFLSKILDENHRLLSQHDWPVSPLEFIEKVASEWLDADSPILPVIRQAFGDA